MGFIPCADCQISPAVKRLLGSILVALLVAAVRGTGEPVSAHGGGKCLEGGCNLPSNTRKLLLQPSKTTQPDMFCCFVALDDVHEKVDITSPGKLPVFVALPAGFWLLATFNPNHPCSQGINSYLVKYGDSRPWGGKTVCFLVPNQ